MPIKFFNIRTGEEREVSTEPQIAAFFNSTDQHVNALLGQDFGWRLAPETVKRLREIQKDQTVMDRIAQMFQLPMGDISATDIVRYISIEDARAEATKHKQVEGDFSREYEEKIRALDKKPEEVKPIELQDNSEPAKAKPSK